MKNIYLVLVFISGFVSCKSKWTEENKMEFVSGCLSAATRDKNIGDSLAAPYCACLVEKIVKKYPNAADAKYIKYDTTAKALSRDCLRSLRP
jgi:hypothetical protein